MIPSSSSRGWNRDRGATGPGRARYRARVMQRARLSWVAVFGLAMAGCSAGDPSTSSGSDLGASSTGVGSSGGEDPSTTTTTPSTVGGSGESGSSTGPSSLDDTGTSTESPADTSTGGCPLGTEGCPCDGGACERELSCLADTCQDAQCDGDVFEDNDDESSPTDLGEINDNDDNGGIVSASLHHPGDVDWYRYQGDDDFTGNVDPARELVSSAGVRLCKFLECDNGLAETEFECPAGTQYALSTMARPGCCATGGVALPDLNCTGVSEDNAAVYIRVDQGEEACVTYSVSYHY